MKKNKRADKVISVYWFAILFLVAAAVVYMVLIFYGKPYDVGGIESNLLTNKIAGCLSQGGLLIKENLDTENFFSKCKLNFNVEDIYDWKEQGQYYFEVHVTGFYDAVSIFDVTGGNVNLKDFCGKTGKNLPTCLEREFYTLDNEKNQFKIKILSAVRKTEKNVQ